MDDLISRREATNELWSLNDQCDSIYYTKCIHDAVYALEILPSAQRWIPCSEQLPDENEAVNIVWVNRSPAIYYQDIKDKPQSATGVYYNGNWYWWSAVVQDYLTEYGECDCDKMDEEIEVTHWMPLPEPPKEKN